MVRLRGWISSDRREKEESIRYLFLIAIKRLRSQLTPRVSRSGTSASPRKGLSPVNIVADEMEAWDDHAKPLERDGPESKDIVLFTNQKKEREDTIQHLRSGDATQEKITAKVGKK